MNNIATVAFILAALPALLFLCNLQAYRRLPNPVSLPSRIPVSVLIPARNEQHSIRATVESILANPNPDLELIVMDDHSTDRTPAIVAELAARDPRLQLVTAPSLPPGWCGKQHACLALSRLARHPLLVFLDADVRLAPNALNRIANFMKSRQLHLASGVPHQSLGTFSERLLIPLIHFVLLGYLPMHWMQRSKSRSFAAGCGQLFVADADAYRRSGGHAMIPNSLHDGVKLPRVFRQAGFRTDLFDATDLAFCRMYHSNLDVWFGLAKNATEGLAAPARIVPMSTLLLGAALLPPLLLAFWPALDHQARAWTVAAVALAWLPRLLALRRFKQPLISALLHPIGVLALVAIQWYALVRATFGRPAVWKGRAYYPTVVPSQNT